MELPESLDVFNDTKHGFDGCFAFAVNLMAPPFVKPYVKSNKNDAHEAEAFCAAVARAPLRFVASKR
jgi:transposase